MTTEQIEQAARDKYPIVDEWQMNKVSFTSNDLQRERQLSFIDGINYYKSQLPDVDWEELLIQYKRFALSIINFSEQDAFDFFKSHLQRNDAAIELIRECEEYLSDMHKQGAKSHIAVNTISTGSILHTKMKEILSPAKK